MGSSDACKSGITAAVTLNKLLGSSATVAGSLVFSCACTKNIKMSNLWQPFTDARRRHVTNVYDREAASFDMTSLAGSSA
jgi:hypothetical protein